MQRHLWVIGQKAIHELGFVGGEVVHDEVDFLAGGLRGHDFLEKADELLTGVAAGRASDDLAAAGLESGINEQGAVTEILKPMTLGPSRRKRQHRIESVEGLDGALFVHAEDGGMGGRGQIQSGTWPTLRSQTLVQCGNPFRPAMAGGAPRAPIGYR